MQNLDLVVTYTEVDARSANSSSRINTPFKKSGTANTNNLLYEYFLLACSEASIKAALSTSNEIIGPGKFSCYWVYSNKKWTKVLQEAQSKLLYMRFTPTTKEQKAKLNLLLSSPSIKIYPSPVLTKLFKDKFATYKKFSDISIPTVLIGEFTNNNFSNALSELKKIFKKHKNTNDFSESVVIKDQFGAAGHNVIQANLKESFASIAKKLKNENKSGDTISYILQPYIECASLVDGIKNAPSDLRVMFLNNRIVDCYARVAKTGDFRTNSHRGGKMITLTKFNKDQLDIQEISQKLANKITIPHSLFSLDFIKSINGNIYLVEANSAPGLDWDRKTEKKFKKLIVDVVSELKHLV